MESGEGYTPGEVIENEENGTSYHAKAALKRFEGILSPNDPENPERTEVLMDILGRFTQKEIDNIQIARTEDGAAFPYTTLNVTELAKELYKTYSPDRQLPAHAEADQQTPRRKDYVVFGSFPSTQNGHPFTFVEYAMQQAVRNVGSLVQGIEAGKPLPEVTVTTFGSPFNSRWGEVTPEYVEKVKQDPMVTIGHSYAEVLKARIPQSAQERERTSVRFLGASMGGRLAVATAEELVVEDDVMTQDQAKRHGSDAKPFLQVLIDSTPGINEAGGSKQVPLGFVTEVAGQTLRHPSEMGLVALREGNFLKEVEKKLEARGIHAQSENEEQNTLKKEATKAIVGALGEPIEPDVHVDSRRGMYDPVLYSGEFRKSAKRQMKTGEIPVNTASSTREWAIKASHLFPFYHQTEMNAWKNAVDKLRSLKQDLPRQE